MLKSHDSLRAVAALSLVSLLAGCSSLQPASQGPEFDPHPIVSGTYEPPLVRFSVVHLQGNAESPLDGFAHTSAHFADVYDLDRPNKTVLSFNFEDLLLLREGDSVVMVIDERTSQAHSIRVTERFMAPAGNFVHFRYTGGHGYMDHLSSNYSVAILTPDTGHNPQQVFPGFPVELGHQRIVKETLTRPDGSLEEHLVEYNGTITVEFVGSIRLEVDGYEDRQGDADWFSRQMDDYTRRRLMIEP